MPIPVFEQEPVPEAKNGEAKKEVPKPLTVKFSGFALLFSSSESCPLGQYEQVRLILHADIAVPLILISVLIYMLIRGKKLSSTKKVVSYGYFGFSLFLLGRIIAETEYYFLRHHELYGKYLVIFTFVILFTILVVQIQERFSKKRIE